MEAGLLLLLLYVCTLTSVLLALSFPLQATHLEDVLHKDISSSPLWSASLLQSDDGHRAIVQTHLDFLEAGAQVISTSTYQASLLSFGQAGLDDHTSKGLLVQSIELAEQARRQYMHSHPEADRPLLSFSLGPYGAALSNGAECEWR